MKKRLTALLLCTAMLCGTLPAVPVTAEETVISQTAEQSDAILTDFLTRIAGWGNASLDDCILISDENNGRKSWTLYTPKDVYPIEITPYTYTRYRIKTDEGYVPDAETLRTKQYEYLTAHGASEKTAQDAVSHIAVEETDGGYIITAVGKDLLAEIPEIRQIDMGYAYHTHVTNNGNWTNGYGIRFRCEHEPSASDFPELEGVSLSQSEDGTWLLLLSDYSYENYFAAFKYLRSLGFLSDVQFLFSMTALSITSDESYSEPCEWKTVYDRRIPDADRSLAEFLSRIAGWENTTLDRCIIHAEKTGSVQLYTPSKMYTVSRLRMENYTVTLEEGTQLEPAAVLKKWKAMLKEAGCPENRLYANRCTLTETAPNTYRIETGLDFYGDLTIADCLKEFWNVKAVSIRYGYFTGDRPNYTMGHMLCIACDREVSAEDFPELGNVTLFKDTKDGEYTAPDGCRLISLPDKNAGYTDYFKALQYVRTLDFVKDAYIAARSTALADESPDAFIKESEDTVLYRRGELVLPVFGDHSLDDPLRKYYLFGEKLLDPEEPKNKSTVFKYCTGQIYVPGGADLPAPPQTEGMTALYSSYSKGWFFWQADTLNSEDAQKLCDEIKAYYAEQTDITLSCDPTPVFCTQLPPTFRGDITGDNAVNIRDAKKLLDAVVLGSISSAGKTFDIASQLYPNADVNGDGKVTIVDAKYILDYSVWTQTMQEQPDWETITGRKTKISDVSAYQ